MYEPSFLRTAFLVLTTTALDTCPFFAFPDGVASLIVTTILSPEDDAWKAVGPFEFDDAAFDGNVVVRRNFFAQLRYAAVDCYPAVADPFFHFAT